MYFKVSHNRLTAYTIQRKCPFRQYIPRKPAKYGIKVRTVCVSRTWHANNMETYAGSQPEGPYIVSEFGQDVILRLVHPIPGTIQNIASNN